MITSVSEGLLYVCPVGVLTLTISCRTRSTSALLLKCASHHELVPDIRAYDCQCGSRVDAEEGLTCEVFDSSIDVEETPGSLGEGHLAYTERNSRSWTLVVYVKYLSLTDAVKTAQEEEIGYSGE